MSRQRLLRSLADTEEFGRRLGELLFPGAVIALVGPLGAGKTHLVRAVAEGLGANSAAVDRKSTRLNSSHVSISYAVFCLKKETERAIAYGARTGMDMR